MPSLHRHRHTVMSTVLVVVLAACGQGSGTTTVGAEGPTDGLEQNDAASEAWLRVDDDARDAAREDGLPDPKIVLTDPVDIEAPGTYRLRAGPVDESAALTSVAVSLPPDLARHATVTVDRGPGAQARLVELGGQRYVELSITASDVQAPYIGLRAWVQWKTDPIVQSEVLP